MITHIEPHILECEVKWALGSITLNRASEGDGIQAELFQILKDDAGKVVQCEVKWSLGSITMNKASGRDGIPVELFQILKDDAVKVWTQYASKFGKLSSGHRTGKGQFSFQSQREAMPKNAQTTTQLHSSHTLAK